MQKPSGTVPSTPPKQPQTVVPMPQTPADAHDAGPLCPLRRVTKLHVVAATVIASDAKHLPMPQTPADAHDAGPLTTTTTTTTTTTITTTTTKYYYY